MISVRYIRSVPWISDAMIRDICIQLTPNRFFLKLTKLKSPFHLILKFIQDNHTQL